MALFEQENRTPAQRIADQLIQSARMQANQTVTQYKMNYQKLWNSPGVDPKDILAELDVLAAPLFQVTNQIMGIAAPEQLKGIPDRYSGWAADAEGRITLTDAVQPDPEPTGSD